MTAFVDSTLEDRCLRYRREYRLPAVIDPTTRHILLHIGTRYGAVTMPTELGEQVKDRLQTAGIVGPVIDHPRARHWTFLTGPARPDNVDPAASAELFRLYATVASVGGQVVLPSPDDENTGYRTWIQHPTPVSDRPPQNAVVDAIREAGGAKVRAR